MEELLQCSCVTWLENLVLRSSEWKLGIFKPNVHSKRLPACMPEAWSPTSSSFYRLKLSSFFVKSTVQNKKIRLTFAFARFIPTNPSRRWFDVTWTIQWQFTKNVSAPNRAVLAPTSASGGTLKKRYHKNEWVWCKGVPLIKNPDFVSLIVDRNLSICLRTP